MSDGSGARVDIAGAGPSGLAAAITVVRAGGRAVVAERRPRVGGRFHGDFQGLENWTSHGDVLEEFASIGIEPTFAFTPFTECVFYDPAGREYVFRSARPMWYLVRRGTGEGTLDRSLERQALDAGVELRLGTTCHRLPDGGIVAHGPRRADAIAAGYVFETDRADGAYAAIGDELAPKGYSYLLVAGGRGTVASCMFDDFHNERTYVERTVAFFNDRVGIGMTNARRFGGFGNVFAAERPQKRMMLYVGEAAGFQDALFGFGLRYAVVSGHLAARAWMNGGPESYDRLWRERLGGLLRLAMVNRYFYEKLGNRGYARLLRQIDGSPDVREWLRRFYGEGKLRRLLYPVAHRRLARKPELVARCKEDCDCTWCRCERHRAGIAAAARA